MRSLLLPSLLVLTPILYAAPHGGDGWITNFAEAKALAKKEGKDLLLDFTGSDWCGWCIKLHKEVFDEDVFKKEVVKHFILVELDFPQEKVLEPELKKQNDGLRAQFAIQGYPTIMLCDAEGKPYAQTGYQAGGAEKYLTHLADLKKKHVARDEALAKAKSLKGGERAKALDAVLDALDKGHRSHYGEIMDEIVKLDADGKAGLRDEYTKLKTDIAIGMKVRMFEGEFRNFAKAKDWKGAEAAINKLVTTEKPTGEGLQKLLYFKAIATIQSGDRSAGAEILKAAIEAAPEGDMAPQLKAMVANLEKAPKEGEEKPDGAKKKGK